MLFADDVICCAVLEESIQSKLDEWRRAKEERRLKISRKKTECLGCNEHQDADIHLQGIHIPGIEVCGVCTRKSPTECRMSGRTGRDCLECCAAGKRT